MKIKQTRLKVDVTLEIAASNVVPIVHVHGDNLSGWVNEFACSPHLPFAIVEAVRAAVDWEHV
jgi:hypothetical protein